MIRFFAAHPTAANLLMLMFIILGVVSLPEIKRETFPEIKSYSVEVSVAYPGASPEDVEQGVCLALEDALDGISFIEEKRCDARQNIGRMSVDMLEVGDFEQFLTDVQSAVDAIDDFPKEAETAIVKEVGRTQDVVSVAISADLPRAELKTLAEQLKQRFLLHRDIPLVDIQGFSARQLRIEVSANTLRQHGLSLDALAQTIQKQDIDLPLGSVTTSEKEIQLRFSDERKDMATLADLIVMSGEQGGELRLKDIATITDTFERDEDYITYNGKPTALLVIKKNSADDSLSVLAAVESVVAQQLRVLPVGVDLSLTKDATSIVSDRIAMLTTNAWQGLLLVFVVMWMFFTIRYAFWVVMGLPVSFLMSFFLLGHLGITINMLSMVALLLALGILMDDAIVIAESIASQRQKGLDALTATVEGTKRVARGVASSFATTLCIFVGLVFLSGDLGQILKVIPIVLISVISVSLIEAFFILPNHLHHALAHADDTSKAIHPLRDFFDRQFERLRLWVFARVTQLIRVRYAFIGMVAGLFFVSIAMFAAGILKFAAFPNIEGDIVQARLLMPSGTSLTQTERVVERLTQALTRTANKFSEDETQPLLKAVTVSFNQHADAFDSGAHLATISADLLTAEQRETAMQDFINLWRDETGIIAGAESIVFKEPSLGPSGRAIEIRLTGEGYDALAESAQQLMHWLQGYDGVENVMSDLRPGKPEFQLTLKPGALLLGIDANVVASQVRAAFQGQKVLETYANLDTYEVTVKLDKASLDSFSDWDHFGIVHPVTKVVLPLSTVAHVQQTRGYSRIHRVDNQRTVSVYGDVDTQRNNTAAILNDVMSTWLVEAKQQYPNLRVSFEGEIKNAATTQGSMRRAFLLGLIGVFILLSFQFKSYLEPLIVMVAIPLALIGVIWGHLFMGLNFALPSMLGFVSLAGIVVNDSILLVEFIKQRVSEGLSIHEAAAKASYDRFRAVFLTSMTTIAGMTPLLFETSLQAQVLIPLATSIVFGIAMSTLLVLFVIPCLYTILSPTFASR